jgi:hypothetical protein
VLPVVLSAGLSGGRRRPLGIMTGLTLSFAFATVALVYVIDALGLPDDLLRNIAIAVLLGFGVALLILAWDPEAMPRDWEGGRQRYFTINLVQLVVTWVVFALLLIALISL